MNAGTKPLLCMNCGYDLRAHADAVKCPECATSVHASRRYAARYLTRRVQWPLTLLLIVASAIHVIWNAAAHAGMTSEMPHSVSELFIRTWLLYAGLSLLLAIALIRYASIINLTLMGITIVWALLAALANYVILMLIMMSA